MTVTQKEVITRLQTVFDELFLDEVIVTPDLSAEDVEEWDSLLHISLVVSIEEVFDIKFRVGEVEATKNVGEFANLIVERMNRKNV